MPAFAAAVATIYEGVATGATLAQAYLTVAAYTYAAYSMYDARRQQRNAQSAAQAALSDRLVTVRSSAASASIVYGRTRVAADTIAYITQFGSAREYITMVLPLAPHEIAGIDEIWFNDKKVEFLDGSGNVTAGAYFASDPRTEAVQVAGTTAGATTVLPHTPTSVLSLVQQTQLDGVLSPPLMPGVDYTISGATITWLATSSVPLVITYTYEAGGSLVNIKKFLGIAAGERDTALETNSGGEWTSAHLGKGIARLHVTLKYDANAFGAIGIPNITAVVRGKKVYDWTTGSTAYSNNAALCLADYLTSTYGFNVPTARIDTTMMQTAQAACDEKIPSWYFSATAATDVVVIEGPVLSVGDPVSFYSTGSGFPSGMTAGTTYYVKTVTDPGPTGAAYTLSATLGGSTLNITANGSGYVYQARYTCDGQISTDANRRDNLKLLAGAMAGKAIYSGGTWRIKAGVYSNPVATLDESDLADGTIQIIPSIRRADLWNSVKGTYPNPQNLYQTDSFPTYVSPTFATEDGGATITADIQLPLTQDAMRAQRIAKRMLYEHRQSLTITANWALSVIALQPGDTVYLKLAAYGWDTLNAGAGKIFVVGNKKMSPTGTVQMTLVETSSAIDAWNYSEATNPDPAPNTSLPDPNYVAPMAGMALTTSASTVDVLSDGTIIPYGVLSWTAITAQAVLQRGRIEVQWKRAAEIAWRTLKCDPESTETKIAPLAAGETINVQVYVYNGAQVRSLPSIGTFVVDSNLPSAVNVASSSGNLLADANFADVGQWTSGVQPGLTDATVWQTEQTAKVAGIPTNAILYQNGSQALWSYAQSPAFPVVPGQRYAAFVDCLPVRASAMLYLQWYDIAGVFLSQAAGNTLPANSGDPRLEANYSTSGVITEAPTGAASAKVVLLKYGTDSGQATSGAYWLKPFCGPVAPGQATYPVWNSGTSPTVTTTQLADQAATRIYTTEFVPAASSDGAYAISKRVAVVQFTAEFTGPCEITGMIDCWHRNTTDPGSTLLWELTSTGATLTGLKDSGSKLTADVGTSLGATAGFLLFSTSALPTNVGGSPTPINATKTFTRSASLVAGQTYNLGITVTANGASTIPGSNFNYIAYANLRVVQIKK